jgi:hypothetical protein
MVDLDEPKVIDMVEGNSLVDLRECSPPGIRCGTRRPRSSSRISPRATDEAWRGTSTTQFAGPISLHVVRAANPVVDGCDAASRNDMKGSQ